MDPGRGEGPERGPCLCREVLCREGAVLSPGSQTHTCSWQCRPGRSQWAPKVAWKACRSRVV